MEEIKAYVAECGLDSLKLMLVRHETTDGFRQYILNEFGQEEETAHFIDDIDTVGALTLSQQFEDSSFRGTVFLPMDCEDKEEAISHESVHIASAYVRFLLDPTPGKSSDVFDYDREKEEEIALLAGLVSSALYRMVNAIEESKSESDAKTESN